MHYFRIFLIISCFVHCNTLYAQDKFLVYEDSLKKIAREIQTGKDDFNKLSASDRFYGLLHQSLLEENSFEYPFDSLISISKLTSEDGRIRIFTWVISKNDGTYEYAGILQTRLKKGRNSSLYKLEDHSLEIDNPENQVLGCNNWYGALYYKLIENSYNDHTWYTLLGWDGNNTLSRKKLIEVLTLSPSGKPVFGASIFSRFPRKCKRIIFEYSANTTMTLNYSTQMIDVRVTKRKKRKIEKEVHEMLVFDRLAPLNKSVEGIYQFYYPETNILDGFIFDRGHWVYAREIDARNDPAEPGTKQLKKVEFELFPSQEDEKK